MPVECSSPLLRLPPNLVWRSYRGGRELRKFRGQPGTGDDHFPEDWLASTVKARNGANSRGPEEGLSHVQWEGEDRALADLMDVAPAYFPGASGFGVLLKLLDSGERLHVQAHPDDRFVRERFGSPHGKTECWYVLATREKDASVLLGFQRPPSPQEWERMILDQDLAGMQHCFDRIPVKPGDCLVVPAGVPHAIGAGVFLLELQQPSDWVVRCEFTVGDHTLPPEARFMGLELKDCFEIFDFHCYAPDAFLQRPVTTAQSGIHIEEEIIDPAYGKFFRLRRLRGTGDAGFTVSHPAVMVVTDGSGTLHAEGHASPMQRGDTFLLPASSHPARWQAHGAWEFLLAHPPQL